MKEAMAEIPALFLERLSQIIPAELYQQVKESFSLVRPLTCRINSLKADPESVFQLLNEQNIEFENIPGIDAGLLLKKTTTQDLEQLKLLSGGMIYIQSLSSLMPVLVLNPQPG